MIQNIIWRHYVKLNTQADVAFCTKDEFSDYMSHINFEGISSKDVGEIGLDTFVATFDL